MKKQLLILAIAMTTTLLASAQVAVNTDGANANPSAILDVKSSDKGMLVPRMTMVQRDAIPLPAIGLLIFQTDQDTGFHYFSDGTWHAMLSGAHSIGDLSDAKASSTSLFMGEYAGFTYTAGTFNTAVGYGALAQLNNANGNTALGYSAGNTVTTGYGNILIGANTNPYSPTSNNELNIGRLIFGTSIGGNASKVGIGHDNLAPNSTLDVAGSMSLPVKLVQAAYTLTEDDYTILATGNITITLPAATNIIGRVYVIKAGAIAGVTINTTNAAIDSQSSLILANPYEFIKVQAVASSLWVIIGSNL